MVDVGSAIGGLVQVCLVGFCLIAASLFYVGKQLSKLSESIRNQSNK